MSINSTNGAGFNNYQIAPNADLQRIFDNSVTGFQSKNPGQSGYERVPSPDKGYTLVPQNLMGGPTYQIGSDGSVSVKYVKPNATFQPIGGPGTIKLPPVQEPIEFVPIPGAPRIPKSPGDIPVDGFVRQYS